MTNIFFVVISLFAMHQLPFIFASSPKLMPLNKHIDLLKNITYTLTCALLSGSQIHFKWSHNNVELIENTDFKIDNFLKYSTLTLKNVQQFHGGVYECRASNLAGEFDVTKTQINIKGI